MSKAILVLDNIPENCFVCQLCQGSRDDMTFTKYCVAIDDYELSEEISFRDRPDWCPLREAPTKALVWGDYDDECCDDEYRMGYNSAINEILGDDNE